MTTKTLLRSSAPLGNVQVEYRLRPDQLLPSKILDGTREVTSHNMWKEGVQYKHLLPTGFQKHSEKGLQAARVARDNILGKMIGKGKGSGLEWAQLSVPRNYSALDEVGYADMLRGSWDTVVIPEHVDDFDSHSTHTQARSKLPHPVRANRGIANRLSSSDRGENTPVIFVNKRPRSTSVSNTKVSALVSISEVNLATKWKDKLDCSNKPEENEWVFLRENIEKARTLDSNTPLCVSCCC